MNDVYLRNWIASPLFCPFCGTKLDVEAITKRELPCDHIFLQFVDTKFVYVSDFFIRLAADHFRFTNPDNWVDDLMYKGRIETDKGFVSAREVLKQILVKLEKDFIRYVHFRCDEGSDLGDIILVADDPYKG